MLVGQPMTMTIPVNDLERTWSVLTISQPS